MILGVDAPVVGERVDQVQSPASGNLVLRIGFLQHRGAVALVRDRDV